MPSAVCAADGAMIWPLPSLPRLRRSGEAKFQPGLSSDARSDGSRAIVPKKVHRAQKKKATGTALLSQPVAIVGVGCAATATALDSCHCASLDMKQFDVSIVNCLLGSRMAVARLIKLGLQGDQ